MNIRYPYRFDHRGRTAEAAYDEHIRELIEQVLFTSPGERVNRVDFGSGLSQLLFGGNNEEIAKAVQFLVQSQLERWLGGLIQVEAIDAISDESQLVVTVQYLVRNTRERRVERFRREVHADNIQQNQR